jgi:pyruvate formate lyase activating enzyme
VNTLFRYAVGGSLLKLIHLYNSFAKQYDMTLEQVIDLAGYHRIRLQSEIYTGMRRCNICNHRCAIATGNYGLCHAVANVGTTLVSTNYGLITAIITTDTDFDFLHFKPDATALYIAGLGCNFHCDACLNACITHVRSTNRQLLSSLVKYYLKPSDVVDRAKQEKVSGIVFGGNEPTVNLDFVLDTASLAKQAGLFVAFQTNGYMTTEAIELLAANVDAVVVGLKAFGDDEVYAWLLDHRINYEHILNTIREFYARGVHVEVTALVLKSNNIETSAEQTSKWLTTTVSREIPLSIHRMARFYSSHWQESYELSSDEVNRIAAICRDSGLVNVYVRDEAHDMPTYCPNCGNIVVQRTAREKTLSCNPTGVVTYNQPEYDVHYVGLNVIEDKEYCANCNKFIYGVWK